MKVLGIVVIAAFAAARSHAGEPMVFAVFGQGRALGPIIGRTTDQDVILEAAQYVCAAGFRAVKAQNPGGDLLVPADRPKLLEGSKVAVDKTSPPVEGTGDPIQRAGVDASAPAILPARPTVSVPSMEPDASQLLAQRVLMLLAICAVGIIAGTAVVLRRRHA